MENDRFDRQKLWFGEEGQKGIELQKVGIIGLGGIGSQINQSLAYLGVCNFVLVDEEIVEETNLNRLVGGCEEDVLSSTPKVVVAERTIKRITPDAKVEVIQANIRTKKALDALKSCPTLFGCVDNDGARLVISEFAAAYSISLIDSATEIIPEDDNNLTYGGRVVVARPGDFCLSCANEIDTKVAKQELANPESREVMRRHGYGLGEKAKAPAVVSLNGVIANLAVTEFLVMITGLREPYKYLHYKADRGMVSTRLYDRNPDCFTCNYLVGTREKANLYRYVQQ
jgi:molybdopterin/thiamine biosynthesis adenylyltransferase